MILDGQNPFIDGNARGALEFVIKLKDHVQRLEDSVDATGGAGYSDDCESERLGLLEAIQCVQRDLNRMKSLIITLGY